MNLSQFYDEVPCRVDTDKTRINAAETKRVLSEAFKGLAHMDSATMLEVLAKGVVNAKKKGK